MEIMLHEDDEYLEEVFLEGISVYVGLRLSVYCGVVIIGGV